MTAKSIPIAPSPIAHGMASDFGWALATILKSYTGAIGAAVAEVPGGERGWRLLSAVAHGTTESQLALAKIVKLDRTVVTYLLDGLAEAGLVERHVAPDDRRARCVKITPLGTECAIRIRHTLSNIEDSLLSPLPAEGHETFRTLLATLAVGLIETGEESASCDDFPTGS
ncbi:MarR family winged helix-turn-helix transcriptional regulator [Mycetocola saprophilus]|uniref:MarR family winged helix-turn-helix transcriptional regulator n=1 Tax=Mycetocola saprophilus TaxID=76636 RepID=UPI003BF38998